MNKEMKTTILVYRFSALGDVVLLLPVLKGVLSENQSLQITLVTRQKFAPLFNGIERLTILPADFERRHKGFFGLLRLFFDIRKKVKANVVMDLHQVIRSNFLNVLFRLRFIPVVSYKKGRKEKQKAIRQKNFQDLPHTIIRYQTPFIQLGYRCKLPATPMFSIDEASIQQASRFREKYQSGAFELAIAPFAKHPNKIWGLDKIESLINLLLQNHDCTIYLIGGGPFEENILTAMASRHQRCVMVAGQLDICAELALFSKVKLALTMDSANMHLFSLLGIPTLSIWGPTHPGLGFSPFGQPEANLIQYNGAVLKCRPCSVYGNKKCIYPTLKCMDELSVDEVYTRMSNFL